MGIEVSTDVSNWNLDPWLSMAELTDSLLSTLSTRGMKSMILGFVVPSGKPRYVKGNCSSLHPRMEDNLCASVGSTFSGTVGVKTGGSQVGGPELCV